MQEKAQNTTIKKAQNGNERAMHQLYAWYAKAMLNTAFRIVNNREDAEDVLQDSFIKAFSQLHQFNFQATFGAWIKRIVVNQSIDILNKKKKVVFLDDSHFPEREQSIPATISDESTQEKLDRLYRSLHQLPDGYRTVFSLYMLEGYDHQEIAQILDIEVSTSISQLSRAKKKLQSLTIKAHNNG